MTTDPGRARHVVYTDPPRADPDSAARLGRFGVATVHEAIGRSGYLGPGIRPAWPGARVGGTAVTAGAGPGDNLMIHVAVEQCGPGDVLVVATNSPSTDGLFGELFATSLAQREPSAPSWAAGPATSPSCARWASPPGRPRSAPRARSRRPSAR